MSEYRRIYIRGGTYFFTLVTYERQKIFSRPENRSLLLDTIIHVRTFHPFTMVAYCILPDHIHLIWTLPEIDPDYSLRVGLIKAKFTKQYRLNGGQPGPPDISRTKRREAAIWQRRFWEHLIRDEQDLERYINYIHYNPIKHGLVENLDDWPDSSFHEYVKSGIYDDSWDWDDQRNEKKYNFGE